MKILIVYATSEGQTRKIARFAADYLSDAGHVVELVPAEDTEGLDLARFDGVILAGSVHVGKIQPVLTTFMQAQGRRLSTRPTLYMQVSLAAAGHDPKEHADLEAIATRLFTEIGWTPSRTEQVAGAFRFTQYDFFKSLALRWIAHQKGEHVDPHADKEYTDWTALTGVLENWVASVG